LNIVRAFFNLGLRTGGITIGVYCEVINAWRDLINDLRR
jgi:hypothetical protein